MTVITLHFNSKLENDLETSENFGLYKVSQHLSLCRGNNVRIINSNKVGLLIATLTYLFTPETINPWP